jgi:hypothetical protein
VTAALPDISVTIIPPISTVEMPAHRRRIPFTSAAYETREMTAIRGIMNAELDFDLTTAQWETLKALRLPTSKCHTLNRFTVDRLVALQLAVWAGDHAVLTEKGRKALVRGSVRLWDVAA